MRPDLQQFAADPVKFFESLIIPSAHGSARFGEVMAPFQRDWFTAISPTLLSIARDEPPQISRFWTERTKGASKDSDVACVLLWLLAFSPRKLDAQVGAADRDQAGELRKAATDILRLNGWLQERIEVQAWTLLCRATDSQCDIISSDAASAHGARPDILVLNELSHVTKEEFASNLLDNATKKPNGLVIIATNAGYQSTWQSRWRDIARTSDRWHFQQLAEPSPWLSEDELAEAERRNSRSRFQRLFWGVWPSQSGDALDGDDITAAVDKSLRPLSEKPIGEHWFTVAGLDLGIRQDHSAFIILLGNRQTLQLRLAFAQSWRPNPVTRKVDLVAVERAILDAHHRFDLEACMYDPYQAALLAQRLELQQVPMEEMCFTGANLNLMASTLLDVFRSRRIELFDGPLIKELGNLSIEERAYGYRLSAIRSTEGGHADLAVALSICLPRAVELVGTVPVTIGAWTADTDFGSPFERAMEDLRRHQRQQQFEEAFLNQPDDHQAPVREIMYLAGRSKTRF